MSMYGGHRRPINPVNRQIDFAIDHLETRSKPVNVGTVVDATKKRVRAVDLLAALDTLLRGPVRARVMARGYKVSDATTYDRTQWLDMDASAFAEQVKIKDRNVEAVKTHRDADAAVQKFLAAKEATLGRPVVAAEFEDEVVAIYAHYGVA